MAKKKILIVFGTRPEAIKMAPLVHAFNQHSNVLETRVCVTAQHRYMLDQVLDFFEIKPHYDLDLMQPNQTLNQLTADVITGMKAVLEDYSPDYVFVHGDTTTSFAAGLAAFYANAKVCHVEAGLRTYNKYAPFPEEMNRQLTARLTDYHFAPTDTAQQNLAQEHILPEKIFVTGNTVIDALLYSVNRLKQYNDAEIDLLKNTLDFTKKIILVTGHRRENFGDGFVNICNALKELGEQRDDIQIVYPVHLNPNVQEPVNNILGGLNSVKLINPLAYPAFVWLMSKSTLLLTDSGGIQEEAPSLGKPVLVMRDTTERPEALIAGTVCLVGSNPELIKEKIVELLDNKSVYEKMSTAHNPYGDGTAAQQIVNQVLSL